ncbi:MAG: TolB family protein [Planctomycetota bacterium]|jgi:Tol biopolymer transport system component
MHARSLLVATLVLATTAARAEAAPQFPHLERVSVSSEGKQGNALSRGPAISADGRVVAFVAAASNLVPDDRNGSDDVLVRDRTTGETVRVSVSTQGVEGNLESVSPAISDDGRVIAFQSDATNLVPGDTNGFPDVFVHDRDTGETTRVSVSSTGVQADLPCFVPAISGDGRVVAFMSYANTLVPDDQTLRQDIFVHERDTGITTLVSLSTDGIQGNDNSWFPSLSRTGRYVAFRSQADNLVANDDNFNQDIFVHDRDTGHTSLVSVATDGSQANSTSLSASISASGRYVSFHSFATNLSPVDFTAHADVYVRDRHLGITELITVGIGGPAGNDHSQFSKISADGRFVGFESAASNLVPGDEPGSLDVFLRDRRTGHTVLVSADAHGNPGDGPSGVPALAVDCLGVVYESRAQNLVAQDTNGETDVYVLDLPDPGGR